MKNEKKLLFVNSSLSDGGSERVMCLIANEFSKRKYQVDMVLLREGKDTYYVNDDIKIIRFKYKHNNKIYKLLKRLKTLHDLMKNDYDYVISFMSDINICTLISNIGINKRIIVSERADPSQKTRSWIQRKMEKILYRFAYKVVLQTEDVKKNYSNKIQKIAVVIPNPINPNLPKRNSKMINKNMVAVGRLTEQKNFRLLIDAFYLFNKVNDNYNLVIYGEGGQRDLLEKQIKELKLDNKVYLPGYIKSINMKMVNSYLYISTSKFEGISNSMLEALAMGIPSICTDCPVGGARLAIKNKVNGILIPIDDKESIVNSLIELTSNHDLYDKISKEAVKINDTFSVKKIGDIWESIIR